jgi:hypothetical protein
MSLSVDNPWPDLPTEPPFVLAVDEPHISAFHSHEPAERHFRLDLLPDPWLGRWESPVVVLLQNPSFDEGRDIAAFRRTDVVRRNRDNLATAAGDLPHYWLDPTFGDTYSGWWWQKRTLPRLIEHFGWEATARSVLAIEMYGYRTRTFRALPITLPSQQFALQLVHAAIDRQATVVLPRAARLWDVALPTLRTYGGVIRGRSTRQTILSAGNLEDEGFDRVLAAIEQAL